MGSAGAGQAVGVAGSDQDEDLGKHPAAGEADPQRRALAEVGFGGNVQGGGAMRNVGGIDYYVFLAFSALITE